jgi:hypothetical protein
MADDSDEELQERIAALEERLKAIEDAVGRLLSASAKPAVRRGPRSTTD